MDFHRIGDASSAINVHMDKVLEYMSNIEDRDIERHLRAVGSDGGCDTLVQRILETRYTPFGWRDYCHCYDHIAHTTRRDIVTYRSAVLRYSETLDSKHDQQLYVGLCLYMAPKLIATGDKEPEWHTFHNGIWSPISTQSIWNAAYNFVHEDGVSTRLGLGECINEILLHRALVNLLKRGGLAHSMLHVDDFSSICDDKDTVFTMPSATYDIEHGIVRTGLPSDLATMSSSVDVDYHEWRQRRSDMMRVLSTWMSGMDVVNTYLDIVSGAISEFKPRYAVVNYGTGSDGKSTWFLVLNEIFGSYCAMLPGTGPNMGNKNGNDATPLANLLVGKRLCLTSDSGDIMSVVRSPDFKSMTGGDPFYLRGMYKEAERRSRRLKQLAMFNTNSDSMSAYEISMRTRLRIFLWISKTISEEDMATIPAHQLLHSTLGTSGYEKKFMRLFGPTLLTELLIRHRDMYSKNMVPHICDKVRNWTMDMLKPKTILAFMECCTEPVEDQREHDKHDDRLTIDIMKRNTGVFLSTLFTVYTTWRRSSGRMTSSDPTTINAFKGHIEHYYPVIKYPVPSSGRLDDYISGVIIKSEFDMVNALAMRVGPSFYGSNISISNTASSIYAKDMVNRFVPADD